MIAIHFFKLSWKHLFRENHNTNKDSVERTFHGKNDIGILYVAQWGEISFLLFWQKIFFKMGSALHLHQNKITLESGIDIASGIN